MSLINQMLKDLEARRQQQDNPGAQTVAVAPCYQKSTRRGMFVFAVVVALLASAGLGGWWYVSRQPQVVCRAAENMTSADAGAGAGQHATGTGQHAGVPSIEPVIPVVTHVPAPTAALELKERVAASSEPEAIGSRHRTQQADAVQPAAPELAVAPTPVATSAVLSDKPAAELHVSAAVSVPEQARQLRVQAQRLLEQHQYSEAVTLLHRAITMAGATAVQWHQLAVASLQARQLAAACQAADAGCEQYAHDVPLRVLQARLLLETGNRQQALAALHRVEPAPAVASASEYYALLATVQQQSGDFAAAQKNYTFLAEAFPDRGEWWIGRAICAEQLGHHGDASAHYQQALRCSQLPPQLKQYALQQLQRLAKG